MFKWLKEKLYLGITPDRYKSLRKHKPRKAIKYLVEKQGAETLNCGYRVAIYKHPANRLRYYPKHHIVLEDAEYISSIFGIEFCGDSGFWNDFDCCRKAEKDGIKLINDIPGLEKGRYVDTPKNRELCIHILEADPRYRVENWLKTYTQFGHAYIREYGDPTVLRNRD